MTAPLFVTRDDTGPGACEVVFLRDLDVLNRGTPGWYQAWTASLWALMGLPLLKALLAVTGAA